MLSDIAGISKSIRRQEMHETTTKEMSPMTRQIAKFALTLVVLFVGGGCLWVISGGWGLSEPARVAFVMLVVAAGLWITEAVPLFVTSFSILYLSIVWLQPVIADDKVTNTLFLAPFFSDIILLFLGGFVLSAALHKFHLDEQMARWIIRRSGGSLPRLMFGVMAVTAFLSMWLSNTATAAMMLSLILPIVKEFPAGTPARKGLVLSIPFAANAGGLGTPIGSPPNAIAMRYMQELGNEPTFGTWMRVGVPLVILVVIIAWGVLRVVYRVRGNLENISCEPLRLTFSPGIVLVVLGTLATIIGWLTGGYHGFSPGTVSLIPLILFFGTGILNVRDLRNLSWDVLLVMGGGLCLCTAMSVSGLASWVVEQLPTDRFELYGVMVVFGVLACFMSSVMSNTATANLIMPIVLGLSITPLTPVLVGVAFACSLAMALPISTPPNAMAFASGELKTTDMLKPGLVLTVVGVALAYTVGYWWWDLIGLF
ncbi:MAG: SLC13 family permease [Verrucomicrobiota bacterium]